MNKKKQTISAVIIAKDAEDKIKGCIKSVDWCDEILVVDTGSKDKTPQISKNLGAKVFKYKKGSFADWRNQGIKKAKSKWILYIDTDERVTKGLKKEIFAKMRQKDSLGAYAIPRKNFILGKEFRHGGQWPDYVKRLFKKDKLRKWTGAVHEEPDFEGQLGHLKHHFIHQKHDSFTDMVEKTNKWSEIEARLMLEAGHPKMNIARFLTAMTREFVLRIIRQRGYLDGKEGTIYSLYQVWSRFLSYAKLWEMQTVPKNKK